MDRHLSTAGGFGLSHRQPDGARPLIHGDSGAENGEKPCWLVCGSGLVFGVLYTQYCVVSRRLHLQLQATDWG
jgi:hypothetical protein